VNEDRLENPARFTEAIYRFELANRRDPNQEMADGAMVPRELLYARRLSAWVLKLCPEASEELRLAAHGQHLCRWENPPCRRRSQDPASPEPATLSKSTLSPQLHPNPTMPLPLNPSPPQIQFPSNNSAAAWSCRSRPS